MSLLRPVNLLILVLFLVPGQSSAIELDARLKWFSTASLLPDHDIQRQANGTPFYDHSMDLRVMARHEAGPVRVIVDHSTVWLHGDTIAASLGQDSAVNQVVTDDNLRRWDWTWNVSRGANHEAVHRLDRLALMWQPGDWSITVGRQAVSWGSGMVFQPMDLFSPFSPTVVDRDYKPGDDLILIDRLLKNGHDLQALHIVRNDRDGELSSKAASTAVKWHGFAANLEFEVVAGRHYDEPVYAVSARLPVGQALMRTDLVASRSSRGEWIYSGILNADVSFVVDDRNGYVFAEYFHNGWGVKDIGDGVLSLPEDLTDRLERGELFNLMRDYVAFGVNMEWHPLISQTATVITNLHDKSSLLQVGFSYSPGDNQTVQMGLIEPLGGQGDEFGGIPVLPPGFGDLTTGGATRIYLRWAYFL